MKEVEKTGAFIKGKELRRLRDCPQAYEFDTLSLLYDGHQERFFIRRAINAVKAALSAKESKESIFFLADKLLEEYDPSWFQSKAEHEFCKERARSQILRLVEYFFAQGYEVLFADFPCTYRFNDPFHCAGRSFHGISQKVDLILARGEERVAVDICNGEPDYSYCARIESRKVSNSLELLSTFLGTSYRFMGRRLRVERWHLKNKDDTASELSPVFEQRMGKNVVGHDFWPTGEEELIRAFHRSLSLSERKDCGECLYQGVCRMKREVRADGARESNNASFIRRPCFTPPQEEVVTHIDGPMCVIAVPGAGKTLSLVHRLVNMAGEGIRPDSVLFVTFAKQAAGEIRNRLAPLLESRQGGGNPAVTTFNALGFSILKENSIFLGKKVRLATDVDVRRLIVNALSTAPRIQGVSYSGIYEKFGLVNQLAGLFGKIAQHGAEHFTAEYGDKKDVSGILAAYDLYCRTYVQSGYVSYDEQVSLCNTMFRKYPALQKKYATRFPYIMVDEFQDACQEQVDLIYGLASHHGNLTVVGDDDQSIYSWRGSSNEHMLNFDTEFPGAKMVYMVDNFRSDGAILTACNALISMNPDRFQKKMIACEGIWRKPLYIKNFDASQLASLVLGLIKKGISPGDIVIEARYNKRIKEVADALEGLVPLTSGKDYVVMDTIFLVLCDVLTLFYDGLSQDEAFYRFFAYHNNEKSLAKEHKTLSLYDNQVGSGRMSELDFRNPECVELYRQKSPGDPLYKEGFRLLLCFRRIEASRDIKEALCQITKTMYNVTEHPVISYLVETAQDKGISSLRQLHLLMLDMKRFNTEDRVGYCVTGGRVNLMTVHDAKGKEFKSVIVYGMEDFSESPEEIRVLYVAMTRAKAELYLTESPYSKCETFPYIENEVTVMEGGSYDQIFDWYGNIPDKKRA